MNREQTLCIWALALVARGFQFFQHQFADFARFGVSFERQFGEHQFAVDGHFKLAAAGGNQFPTANIGFDFSFTQNFVRQTDGARRVFSNRAVFYRYI